MSRMLEILLQGARCDFFCGGGWGSVALDRPSKSPEWVAAKALLYYHWEV